MMNLGGLDGSVTTLGGRVKLTGKAAGLARRAVYAVSEADYLFWKQKTQVDVATIYVGTICTHVQPE